MLKIKYNDIDTVINVDEFYSHEMKIHKLPPIGAGTVYITYRHELKTDLNNASLLALLLILKNLRGTIGLKIVLDFDYMPFSRMDKPDTQFEETLKPYLLFLEPLVDRIYTNEIHSKGLFEAIFKDKYRNFDGNFVNRLKAIDRDFLLVAVDYGVEKRHGLNLHFNTSFMKRRENGVIVEQYLNDPEVIEDEDYNTTVFLDDICSKGTTFIGAAKIIKKIRPDMKLVLFVEFMEFEASKAGLTKELYDTFDEVHYHKYI